jgi:glycosyltransferase involved in cell wall biosynthesis
LTKNEEQRLPRALERLPAGARILVVDAESTDATVAIARARGAQVEVRPWSGYVDTRRYALGRVATPYAFMLDADEAFDETLADALEGDLGAADGYRVRRVTMFAGRAVRAAGWSSERLVRAFRVDRARVVPNSVGGGADLHERWIVQGLVGDLPGTIVHDSYPTIASYHEKFERYTALEAAAIAPSPMRLALALAQCPARFAWSMLRYQGWRDGWRGFFVSWYFGAYPVVVQWRALRRS